MKADELSVRARLQFMPPGTEPVSEWADKSRMLSPEAAAEPGKWVTGRAEYQRAMMDACTGEKPVVFCCSAQMGKTEILLNLLLSWIMQDPGPVLVIQPTLTMGEAFARDRLWPMIRDTPALSKIFPPLKSRLGGQTSMRRAFPGGVVTIVGANAPAGLASRPIRYLLADEVDRYPIRAGSEGDPLTIAIARQSNFWNRKTIIASTPTTRGASRIWAAWEESDGRLFHIPCPHCGQAFPLEWSNVKWTSGEPASAHYVCPKGCAFSEREKDVAVGLGHWVVARPNAPLIGFRVSALYSPWIRLKDIVAEFLTAKDGGVERLKAFTNLRLAEVWDDQRQTISVTSVLARATDYKAEVPDEVLSITAGVDVQQSRIEVEVLGHGLKDAQYGIGYHILEGDTIGAEVWKQLDEILLREYMKADGSKMRIKCSAVDAGFNTQTVAPWCQARTSRGVVAVRGSTVKTTPPVLRAKQRRDGHVGYKYLIGGHILKEFLFHRIKAVEKGGESCLHWPLGRGYDESYFLGLCSEELRLKKVRGYTVTSWEKTRERNEPLDCRVYALGALHILAPQWRARGIAAEANIGVPPPVPAVKKNLPGFVNNWRF